MTLAQVVYNMSTDEEFASQLYSDPESALAKHGWKLSQEELDFLLSTHNRGNKDKVSIVSMANDVNGAWRF
jgi:hypothetical protein